MALAPERGEAYKDFVRRVAGATNQRYSEAQSFVKRRGLWRRRAEAPRERGGASNGQMVRAILEGSGIPSATPLGVAVRLGRVASARLSRCRDAETRAGLEREHRAVWDAIKKHREQLRARPAEPADTPADSRADSHV